MAPSPPVRPFGGAQFGPPRFSLPRRRAYATGQCLVSGALPGSGQRGPGRCSVAQGRSWYATTSKPHSLLVRVGDACVPGPGGVKPGPALALGLRGTTCPRPVCGPLGPSGGPMPLRFCGAMPGRVGIGLPAAMYLRPPRFRGRLGMVPIFGCFGEVVSIK